MNSRAISEVAQYNAVSAWCSEQVSSGAEFMFHPVLFHEALYEKSKEFRFQFEGLHSFFRNTHLLHVKKTSHLLKERVDQIAKDYTKGESLLSLSRKINYPPALLCRILVETLTPLGKHDLTHVMRNPICRLGDPSLIEAKYQSSELVKRGGDPARIDPLTSKPTTRLAQEVMEALDADPMYGPRHDRESNDVGIEYEKRLEEILTRMDVPFESEAELRERGTSRTPDVLLSCPMGVPVPKRNDNDDGWRVICWIDSKAMFGDVKTHQTSVLPQAESYLHRFGPGLILYWFGHAPLEMLDDAHGDIVVSAGMLPEPMLFPTGEVATADNHTEQQSDG